MSEAGGLFSSLRRLLATLLGIVSTRIELLVNEWEEERLRLMRMFLYAVLAMFCVCMGMVLLTFFIVVLFWHDSPLLAVSVLGLLYFAAAGLFAWLLVRLLRQRSVLFSASLAELRKDRHHLGEDHE
jgi:uncharacterized membrane protein YqjE